MPSMNVEMLELPDDILSLIARQVLDKEDGLRLWCKLSSTCRRLKKLLLPAEPTYFLDNSLPDHGKRWALERLRRASKVNLTVSGQRDGQHGFHCDWAMIVLEASQELEMLNTLALSICGNTACMQVCQASVRRLLLGARSLTALSTDIASLPRAPVIQHLSLRHLEVVVSSRAPDWLEGFFHDVSRSRTLESLRVICNAADEFASLDGSLQLPSMHLQRMPSLQHVRLDNCVPVAELSLPADCALFLDVSYGEDIMWHENLGHHTTVLRLFAATYIGWPPGIQSFSNLQFIEVTMWTGWCEDLADLRHIPHVRVMSDAPNHLQLTAGSWQTLEVLHFAGLRVSFSDVDSFVRDTGSFAFMSQQDDSIVLMQEVQDACLRQGRACHVVKHNNKQCGKWGATRDEHVTYVILSTSKEVAEDFPRLYNFDEGPHVSFERGVHLADPEDFWPCNPCASVKRA